MAGTGLRIADFLAQVPPGLLDSEGAFVARYPFPFLLQEATGSVTAALPAAGDRSTVRVPKKAVPPTGGGFSEGDVTVFRVCPRDLERNEGAVTLGRDGECDVVVDDPTISLRHAAFTIEAAPKDDDEDDGRAFFVADLDSSNGTFVDGEPVAKGARRQVDDQTSLRFGPAVKMQFFTARGFFQFLEFFRRMKSKKKKAP